MGLDHKSPAYTEQAAPFVGEAGGKMGGLEYLRAQSRTLRNLILPAQLMKPGEQWNGATVKPGNTGKFIVRASHPNDFQGLVDVIETEVVDQRTDIGQVIERMRQSAKSTLVMSYGKYENPNYDGEITVGVQPYMRYRTGSVVEHPNQSGRYVISYVQRYPDSTLSGVEIDTGIYDPKQGDVEFMGGNSIKIEQAKKIAEMYQLIVNAGLVRDDYSFQVEFLDDGRVPQIAQVRAFARKQIAQFKVDGPSHRLVFGVTGPEGIELPVMQSPDGFDWKNKPLQHDVPWALLKTKHDDQLPLDFQPEHMRAYLVSQSWDSGLTASLEHHHFRLAQKADVTVFEDGLHFKHDFTKIQFGSATLPNKTQKSLERIRKYAKITGECDWQVAEKILRKNAGLLVNKARITSDGRAAIVEPIYSDAK